MTLSLSSALLGLSMLLCLYGVGYPYPWSHKNGLEWSLLAITAIVINLVLLMVLPGILAVNLVIGLSWYFAKPQKNKGWLCFSAGVIALTIICFVVLP